MTPVHELETGRHLGTMDIPAIAEDQASFAISSWRDLPKAGGRVDAYDVTFEIVRNSRGHVVSVGVASEHLRDLDGMLNYRPLGY